MIRRSAALRPRRSTSTPGSLRCPRGSRGARALEKAGIISERLTGSFRGQLDPRSSGAEDKAKNRRVDIYLNG